MAERDLPDRTTTAWLHLARDDGTRRTSAEDVKKCSTREHCLTVVFRARTFHIRLRCVNDSDRVERTASR
ncbi:hypothetical protein [Rhodanobacter terrae]|uniref:Uncharacterized protein n=1 Tax=Rhodanobacter terrae TaxID=418647 RepID=A0ABW0SYJ7_9GAMM